MDLEINFTLEKLAHDQPQHRWSKRKPHNCCTN